MRTTAVSMMLVICLGALAFPKYRLYAESTAEQELQSLEERMEALQRANSPERTALWADDLVYIGNDAAMHNKADLTRAIAGGEVNVESLEVSERRIRVYGDLAIVTAMEQRRTSFQTKPQDETLQYTRVWARRSGAWRVVSFQETKVVQGPRPPLAGFEACSSAQRPPPTPGSLEQMILKLDYDHALANTAMFKGDEATRAALGHGMVAEDYVAINGSGNFGDKAGAMRRYGPGGVKILSEKFANMRARVFGDAAIVTGTWCFRSVREGTVEAPPGAAVGTETIGATRITRVWVKRNGEWKVVSWQGTAIPKQESVPGKTAQPTNDANRAQDEAALRKKVADGDDAWNRRDVKALLDNARLTENCDHISVRGNWLSGRAQVYEVFREPTMSIHRTIERIRFITPEVAVLVIRSTYTRDNRSWDAMSILVHHKINGQWWLESFQNTLVQSREEAIAQAERATSPMAQTEPLVITPAGSKIDFSGDVAAILQMGADSTDAWNRRDPKALAARISEDHDQIGVTGAWGSGRAQFEKALTAALAATRNNQRRSVAKIRFIAPDVAIVVARREYPNDKETLKSISTAVFHKVNGEWWNEAFQNTYVRPPVAEPTR